MSNVTSATLSDDIDTLIEIYRLDILKALGYKANAPPVLVDERQAAHVLGVSPNTLSVWRSLGRYNIPFIKSGRLVRYRVDDLAKFLARRTMAHTGKIA
jgi:hypothetical protein